MVTLRISVFLIDINLANMQSLFLLLLVLEMVHLGVGGSEERHWRIWKMKHKRNYTHQHEENRRYGYLIIKCELANKPFALFF